MTKKYNYDKCINRLNNYFWEEFLNNFNIIDLKNKEIIYKYLPQIYKKWLYSTLIENTDISPNNIISKTSSSIYSSMFFDRKNKENQIKFTVNEFDLNNHKICNDFRLLIDDFKRGMVLNYDNQLEDLNQLKCLVNYDLIYINYLIKLAINAKYIEKMYSLNTNVFCCFEKKNTIYNINDFELLKILYDSALKVCVENLNDDMFDGFIGVKELDIENLLKYNNEVSYIFEHIYKSFNEYKGMSSFDDYDEMKEIKKYKRGIDIDKWFLTPFSYYFGFIDNLYLSEFSFIDELIFAIKSIRNYTFIKDDVFIDSFLYSPSSKYRLSNLGEDFFLINQNRKNNVIFRDFSNDEILDLVFEEKDVDKILEYYDIDIELCLLKIQLIEDRDIWFEMEIDYKSGLDILSKNILTIVRTKGFKCDRYKFYKEPETIFTQYFPKFLNLKGNKVEDFSIENILKKKEKIKYEIVLLNEDLEREKHIFDIELLDIKNVKKLKEYPIIINRSEKLK